VRGARTKRRAPLSAEAITAAAIRIADRDGLDAVSIRNVAAALDARPMSLYDHFESKDDLLSSMADEVSKEILIEEPLPEEWRQALAGIARRMYGAFVSHSWVISIYTKQPRFGPGSTRLAKQMAEAVANIPLESAEVWALQGTVNDYVLGHSLRAVTTPRPGGLADVSSEIDLAGSPELASLPAYLRSRDSIERFEFGLQSVLDGVERRILAAIETGGGDDAEKSPGQRKRARKGE
jgi:AcrR family transcriptional regulator